MCPLQRRVLISRTKTRLCSCAPVWERLCLAKLEKDCQLHPRDDVRGPQLALRISYPSRINSRMNQKDDSAMRTFLCLCLDFPSFQIS